MALSVPGTTYTGAMAPDVDADEYESHFNATQTAEGWDMSPLSGIPIIGDIFAGFNLLWSNIGYLLDGFPALLTYISDSYITNYEGQLAFDIIANTLRAVYALLIVIFLIEFISGRIFTD